MKQVDLSKKLGEVPDGIRDGLNLTGVFLEKKVFLLLAGNQKVKAKREEPYSGFTSDGFEGTIDVFAASLVKNDTAICLCIECKRANPEQKHWVFETRSPETEPPFFPFDYRSVSGKIEYEKNIFFPSLGYNGMQYFDRAIQVFEFKEIAGELSRNQSEKAFNALRQANEAVSSFIQEPDRVAELLSVSGNINILFLPIVVTTANLWMLSYDSGEVSWETGTVPMEKMKFVSKDWVHMEFPLSNKLRVRNVPGLGPIKRPSFVVKSDKFGDFVDMLLCDCPRYILDWN